MLDLQVRRRFALMRRGFATLGFAEARPSGRPAPDLMLDDSALAPTATELRNAVDWRGAAVGAAAAGLFAHVEERDDAARRTREAVFRLAHAIRLEGEALAELARRACAQARRAASEEAALAAGARVDAEAFAASLAARLDEAGRVAFGASLAAVRAGASARGFCEAAQAVASLARLLEAASEELDALVCGIEERSAEAAALAGALRGRVVVDGEPSQLRIAAGGVAADAARVAALCDTLAEAVDDLAERLFVLVRRSPVGDRRAEARIPVDIPCAIETTAGVHAGRARDLSTRGALVALDAPAPLRPAQPLRIALADAPPIAGVVVSCDAEGLRVAFDLGHEANAAARPRFLARLAAAAASG